MEGTAPNQSTESIEDLIKTIDMKMAEITSGMMEIKEKQEEDFSGEGIDITDSLPTIDEALKLRKENDELKDEIFTKHAEYGTNTDIKKIDVAHKQLSDYYNTMTSQQKMMLVMKLAESAGGPAEHQDVIEFMTYLLKQRDEYEDENDELKEELSGYHQIKSSREVEGDENIVLGQIYPPGIVGMKNLVECWDFQQKENEELKKEIEGFKNGGVFKDITQENEKLKKEIEKLKEKSSSSTANKPPYPEPPPGAPYLWKNAMCHHTLCNVSPDECGYAHTIEEARYYQKRRERKDVKQQNEIKHLQTQVKDLTSKIPSNHHKRLSPYDKRLLGSILGDVECLEHAGNPDEVEDYKLYAPKKKLLVRLLK